MNEKIEELYKKYRPTKLSEIAGNNDALAVLRGFARRRAVPHCLLLTGPSGCGKTTLARILRRKLRCGDHDFKELNTADFRGIDMVREIRSQVGLSPMDGETRVWLLDECHQLSMSASQAFLKLLEDTPLHVYFMLATTEPQKLLRTIRTRATEIGVKPLGGPDMGALLGRVADAEGFELFEDVRDKIVDAADGSPRKALVLLNAVIGEPDEERQLAMVAGGVAEREAIEIARALMNPRSTWADVSRVLKGIEGLDEAAEGIRYLVLAYMSTVSLNNSRQASRACDVIELFSEPFWNTKRAGLIAACHEAVSGG